MISPTASFMRFSFFSSACCLGFLIAVCGLLVAGCNPPPRPSFKEISIEDEAAKALASEPKALPEEPFDPIDLNAVVLPWETWHSYFMGNKPVGFIHVQSNVDEEGGTGNVRTTIVDQLTLRRGTTTLVQSLRQSSLEAPQAGLVSFTADLRIGTARTVFDGQVAAESLSISMTRGSEKVNGSVPWSNLFGGLAAVQQSLLAKPMKQNEKRRLKLLIPVQYQLGTVELDCSNRASISTMEGKVFNALEISVKTLAGSNEPLESMIWTDDNGNVLKTYTPAVDLSAIRSTREAAEAAVRMPPDLFSVVSVEVKGNITTPNETYRAGFVLKPRYKAEELASDPSKKLSLEPQSGQWFRDQGDGTIQLLVSRDPLEPTRSEFKTLMVEPEDGDRRNGPIIDSDAASVRKLASLSQATDQKIVALDLARTVKQLVGPGDFSRGFGSASQTAQDGVGDCTERAVLLAAMLRAREIPSKVVAGLVYQEVDEKPRMAYHMWTLAWVNESWISLDATIGGLAPADRIAIASSNLADGNEYKCLAPVLAAIGKIDVEIVNAKYQPLK